MDELWDLHEQVVSELGRKMATEQARLEKRLRMLGSADRSLLPKRDKRPYPEVLPKYQNPKNPAERWSGRGKQPHWVQAQLKTGKKLEQFLIARLSAERRSRTG
jgi:DNA-binding protein H-NS